MSNLMLSVFSPAMKSVQASCIILVQLSAKHPRMLISPADLYKDVRLELSTCRPATIEAILNLSLHLELAK
jgi:hypothetical protein